MKTRELLAAISVAAVLSHCASGLPQQAGHFLNIALQINIKIGEEMYKVDNDKQAQNPEFRPAATVQPNLPGPGSGTCTTKDGVSGKCVAFFNCPQLSNSPFGSGITQCGHQGDLPLVCCPTNGYGVKFTYGPTQESISRTTPRSIQVPTPNTTVAPTKTPSLPVDLFPKACGITKGSTVKDGEGKEADIGTWPWMAAIYFVSEDVPQYIVAGSIINQRYVVTVAQVTVGVEDGLSYPADKYIVRVGDHDLLSVADGLQPVIYAVSEVTPHKNYNVRNNLNDIALLRLESPIKFTSVIQPLCVPYDEPYLTEESIVNRKGYIAGWGSESHGSEMTSVLKEGLIRPWSNEDCDVAYRKFVISETFLCAGGIIDACEGDSGAPFMMPNKKGRMFLMGIVSFGIGCGNPKYPGVYTRVSKYLEWLKSNMRP